MVDSLVEHKPILINEISSSISHIITIYDFRSRFFVNAGIRSVQNAECSGQVSIAIGQKIVGYTLNTAIVFGGTQPGEMHFRRIARGTDHNGISLFKLRQCLLEGM